MSNKIFELSENKRGEVSFIGFFPAAELKEYLFHRYPFDIEEVDSIMELAHKLKDNTFTERDTGQFKSIIISKTHFNPATTLAMKTAIGSRPKNLPEMPEWTTTEYNAYKTADKTRIDRVHNLIIMNLPCPNSTVIIRIDEVDDDTRHPVARGKIILPLYRQAAIGDYFHNRYGTKSVENMTITLTEEKAFIQDINRFKNYIAIMQKENINGKTHLNIYH